MFQRQLQSKLAVGIAALSILSCGLVANSSIAEEFASMDEDQLVMKDGLPWSAPNWEYGKVINIRKFGGEIVGRAALDRHVERNPIDDFPFTSAFALEPVAVVFVSQWGSRNEGCYMEMLVQFAPPPLLVSARDIGPYLAPREVKIDAGNQRVVTLLPQKVKARVGGPYSYEFYHFTQKKRVVSNWYQAKHLFKVTADDVKQLSTAKPGNARVRVTFFSGNSYQFPIGEGTVTRWKDAFGYNPTCRPGGHTQVATQPQPSISTTPISKPASTPKPVQQNSSQSSSTATQPKPSPSPVQQLARNAIGSTNPAKYPSNDEFKVLNQELKTAQSGVQLSAAQRRTWQSFKGGWSKTNPPIARFLGTWYSGDRYYYVYPSKVRSRVCVIVKDQDQVSSRLGTVLNKELRNGNSSFFWIDKEDVLAARDSGEEKLYPLFATQVPAPELSAEILEAMDRAQCQKSLPQVEQAFML